MSFAHKYKCHTESTESTEICSPCGERLPHEKATKEYDNKLVEDKVIVELKSVDEMKKVFAKQLLTYLRLMNKKVGLLVNFNTDNILKSITRVAN